MKIYFFIHKVVYKITKASVLQAKNKGLEFYQWINPAVPGQVQGDSRLLSYVLQHLLENALRYTITGRVCLKISPVAQGYLSCLICDTGCDIAEAYQKSIFTSQDTTGLYDTCQLLKIMGGEIWMESMVDVGSRFYFTIRLSGYVEV